MVVSSRQARPQGEPPAARAEARRGGDGERAAQRGPALGRGGAEERRRAAAGALAARGAAVGRCVAVQRRRGGRALARRRPVGFVAARRAPRRRDAKVWLKVLAAREDARVRGGGAPNAGAAARLLRSVGSEWSDDDW
jgi:hypothetical protein